MFFDYFLQKEVIITLKDNSIIKGICIDYNYYYDYFVIKNTGFIIVKIPFIKEIEEKFI